MDLLAIVPVEVISIMAITNRLLLLKERQAKEQIQLEPRPASFQTWWPRFKDVCRAKVFRQVDLLLRNRIHSLVENKSVVPPLDRDPLDSLENNLDLFHPMETRENQDSNQYHSQDPLEDLVANSLLLQTPVRNRVRDRTQVCFRILWKISNLGSQNHGFGHSGFNQGSGFSGGPNGFASFSGRPSVRTNNYSGRPQQGGATGSPFWAGQRAQESETIQHA